jgi:hypothetical protein
MHKKSKKTNTDGGAATLLDLLDTMDPVTALGTPTYTGSFKYGGEEDVPWEWLHLWGWVHGIDADRLDMICNPVYLTNIVRYRIGDEAITAGTTVKYAGVLAPCRLEGETPIDDAPDEFAADFLFNVVTTLTLKESEEIRAFLAAPLKEGQRLELLTDLEVRELLVNGVHVVPDPKDASDTAAMVKNAAACMRALDGVLCDGAQNMS